MDIDRVREMTDAEIDNELATQRRHLYDLRFQLATRQLTDHNQLSQTRRTIARILTVQTERQAQAGDGRPQSGGRERAAATTARGGKP